MIEKNFEAKGREFAKFLRSLEQFIQTVKGQNNVWQQNVYLTCSWRFLLSNKLEQLELKLEKKWDLKTCKRSQTIFLTVFVNESVFMIIDLFKPTENLALTDF